MLLILFLGVVQASFSQGSNGTSFDINVCGVSASCMANIRYCQLGDDNCALASWRMVDDDLEISMAFIGQATWVGFALGAPDRKGYHFYMEEKENVMKTSTV